MALDKAIIAVKGGEKITVLFNPGQYTLDKTNQYTAIEAPGAAAPTIQYVSGGARQLSMDLFFDTYEQQADVRAHTNRLYNLMEIKKETHVPPVCTFIWGSLLFTGVVTRISGRFTLFLPSGIPVRAVLGVTFQEVVDGEVKTRGTAMESVDRHKTRVVTAVDSLSSIAAAEYGDPAQWRVIARANNIVDPRRLAVGSVLRLPPLS